MKISEKNFPAWSWVPGVYFAEGLPFAVATSVSIVIFKTLGMSNSDISFWTSLIALPWSFKFLWTPFIDAVLTKRFWMLLMQLCIGVSFLLLALSFTGNVSLACVIVCFFLTAFLSATHDAAADGYYMLALDSHGQAFYSGFRNIFYKCAMIAGQGGLVLFAGWMQKKGLSPASSWRCGVLLVSSVMFLLSFWHLFAAPEAEKKMTSSGLGNSISFREMISSFFMREGAVCGFLFLFFYRFAESQLGKMSVPFMLDPVEKGGLGMTLLEQGEYYGIAGTIAFLFGGFLAGAAVARFGFGKCFWGMALALNLPDLLYVFLAWLRPVPLVSGCAIAFEQFGYGLGYMAHILFMVQFAEKSGKYKTSHFAFMTGITILGMTLFGMFSGHLQQFFSVRVPAYLRTFSAFPAFMTESGYFLFFLWIAAATIPSFLSVWLVKPYIDSSFGKKTL